MMTMKVELTNKDFVNNFMKKFPTVIETCVRNAAVYGKAKIMKDTPRKTGTTRRAWRIQRMGSASYGLFNDTYHAIFLEWGTGLFGPLHKYITPITAKFLHFPIIVRNTIKGWIRIEKVKGMKPFHMVEKNFQSIHAVLENSLKKEIKATWEAGKSAGVLK